MMSYRVHLRQGEHWQSRPVPLVEIREGLDEAGPPYLAIVPDIGNNNRLQGVPVEDTALCFDSCRICMNVNSRPRRAGMAERTGRP